MPIQSNQLGTGGWRAGLRTDSLAVAAFPAFLASDQVMVKRAGITLAAATVTADGNGDKILVAGTFVAPLTSTADVGKYGPYASGASDGRQTPDASKSGYLLESVNLRDGDVVTGCMIAGSVLKARVTPSSAAAMDTAVAGRIIFQ